MIFTSDEVTSENHWQITSRVHYSCIILYIIIWGYGCNKNFGRIGSPSLLCSCAVGPHGETYSFWSITSFYRYFIFQSKSHVYFETIYLWRFNMNAYNINFTRILILYFGPSDQTIRDQPTYTNARVSPQPQLSKCSSEIVSISRLNNSSLTETCWIMPRELISTTVANSPLSSKMLDYMRFIVSCDVACIHAIT